MTLSNEGKIIQFHRLYGQTLIKQPKIVEIINQIQTALIIARRDKNTGEDIVKFQELFEGIRNFNPFLIEGYFRIEQAQAASARVAYLASKLQNEDYSELEVYSSDIDIKELEIKNIQSFSKQIQKDKS